MNDIRKIDGGKLAIPPLDGPLTPKQLEESAALQRQYFMKGLWHWLPVWETIGEPWRYPSHQVSRYPIGHQLHRWPSWADIDDDE